MLIPLSRRAPEPPAPLGLQPGTGLHAIRHLYASLLIRYGESVKTVQRRLGHSSAAVTLDTYAHLWPDADDTTPAVLGRLSRLVRTLRGPRKDRPSVCSGQKG